MALSPIALRVSRIAALLFALSVLSYLAFEAQRRANPPAHAGAQPNREAVDAGVQYGPAASEASDQSHAYQAIPIGQFEAADEFMYSSKSMPLPLVLPDQSEASDPFISGSKSGVIILPEGFVTKTDEGDRYLPSSKVLMLDIPDVRDLPSPLVVESNEPVDAEGDTAKTP